ncbi:MAG: DMT family transporter [Holosporales bacterium]|nr:DMT family transporter [Holosporales bacterium]
MKIPQFVVSILGYFRYTELQAIGNIYGAVLTFFVNIIRSIGSSVIHSLPKNISSIQSLFIESAFAFLFLFLFFLKDIKSIVLTKKPILQILKSCCNITGTYFLFEGIRSLPLVIYSVLSLFSIFFAAIGAFLFFLEKPSKSIIFSIFLSIFGVVFITKFKIQNFSISLLFPIISAFFFSLGTLLSKKIAIFDSLRTSLFWCFLLQIIFLAIPVNSVWQPVNFDTLFKLSITSLSILVAMALAIQAESFSAIAFCAPFKTLRVLFSALLGLLFFNEVIQLHTLIGIFCIIISYIFVCKSSKEIISYYVRKMGKEAIKSEGKK